MERAVEGKGEMELVSIELESTSANSALLGLFPNHLLKASEWLPGRDAFGSPATQSNVNSIEFQWSRETTSVSSSVFTDLTTS